MIFLNNSHVKKKKNTASHHMITKRGVVEEIGGGKGDVEDICNKGWWGDYDVFLSLPCCHLPSS